MWRGLLFGLVYLQSKGQYSGNINPRFIMKTHEGRYKIINNLLTDFFTHYDLLRKDMETEEANELQYCFLSPLLFDELGKNNK